MKCPRCQEHPLIEGRGKLWLSSGPVEVTTWTCGAQITKDRFEDCGYKRWEPIPGIVSLRGDTTAGVQ